MDESNRRRWFPMVVLLGAVYFLFGVAFAALAGWSGSDAIRATWNRLGFLASAVAFAFHLGYEHFRFRNSALITALHVPAAVGLGAFALAVRVNVNGFRMGAGNQGLRAFALVAWPAITAILAFLVAIIAAALLKKAHGKRQKLTSQDHDF